MSDSSFAGLPVSGDINHYTDSPADQRPLSELEPLFQALLNDPEVAEFGWRQYTPYFNDGDACVFHVSLVWVKPVNAKSTEDEDYEDNWAYEVRRYAWSDEPASPQHHIDFTNAIQSGSYNVELSQKFGDPAEVTVTRNGITVAFYDHE